MVVSRLYWSYRSGQLCLKSLLSKRRDATFFQVAVQPSPSRVSVPVSTISALSLSVRASASASSSRIMCRTARRSFAVRFSSVLFIVSFLSGLMACLGGVGFGSWWLCGSDFSEYFRIRSRYCLAFLFGLRLPSALASTLLTMI